MAVKSSCLVFVLLVLLQVTLEPATATITQTDVESCISGVKTTLQNQQGTAKKRLEELKTRKTNDMKELMKERYENMQSSVQNEKNVLSKLKQSAIQDDFNVTMCNDTSAIYDLILNSFQSSSSAVLAEYKNVVERNHTQNSLLVDRLALKYQELEKELGKCLQQSDNSDCFDAVEDQCEIFGYKNEISDLESSYNEDAEKTFVVFKKKVSSLFEQKVKEVKAFSSEMKSCYTSVKNTNSTKSDVGNGGASFQPLKILVVLPFVYKVFSELPEDEDSNHQSVCEKSKS